MRAERNNYNKGDSQNQDLGCKIFEYIPGGQNKKTAKNGVMILKRTFKGRNINPQYNLKVNTNIYSQHSQNEVGKNFSIIAK